VKRNNGSIRAAHNAARKSKSRYAEKVRRGNMMYGPGCCGHRYSHDDIEKMKAEARRNGHHVNRWG
jgi:hypothetical protein